MGATSSVNKPPYYDSSSSNQDSSSSNRQERGVEICKKDHCIHHPIEDYLLISTQTTETRYQEGRNSLICSIDPTFLKIPCYHRYPFQDYKFLKKIGQGKFCSIYKGGYINEIVNPEKIAIKEYNIHQLPNHIYYEDLIYEINILSQLNEHPNILEIHKIYEPSSNSSSNGKNNTNAKLYVIMEYLRGGEFLDGIIHYGKYTLLDIMTIFQQVISAIYFLHSHGITYNNLIPENIILKNHYQGGGYGKRHLNIIKLVGFEKCESTCLQYRKRPLIRENQDSLFFPPETISNPINSNDEATSYFLSFQKLDKKNQIILKEANDIWCAAELFYFLIAAKLPSEKIFYQQNETVTFHGSVWDLLGSPAKAFFHKALNFNPLYRATAEELARDPWLDIDFESQDSLQITDVDLSDNLEMVKSIHTNRTYLYSQKVACGKVQFHKSGRFQEEQVFAALITANS